MLKELYLNAEHEDSYLRDQSVFGDGISIEDTLVVMVKYRNKTLLTYLPQCVSAMGRVEHRLQWQQRAARDEAGRELLCQWWGRA